MKGDATTDALKVRQSVEGPSSVVRGLVEDAFGAAMPDATVKSFAIEAGGASIYGLPSGLDPIAVTNGSGFFELLYIGSASKMALMVEARGMAPKFIIWPTGPELQRVVVSIGAVVRGRVMKEGKPVAGIEVGLSPRESWRGAGDLDIKGGVYDEIRIGTRDDGTFVIANVPVPEEWELFPTMESTGSIGTAPPPSFATVRDSQDLNLGNIHMKNGYHLRGILTTGDRKPIQGGNRVYIQCNRTRDT